MSYLIYLPIKLMISRIVYYPAPQTPDISETALSPGYKEAVTRWILMKNGCLDMKDYYSLFIGDLSVVDDDTLRLHYYTKEVYPEGAAKIFPEELEFIKTKGSLVFKEEDINRRFQDESDNHLKDNEGNHIAFKWKSSVPSGERE